MTRLNMVNDGETGGQRKKSSKEQNGRHIGPPSSLIFTGHPRRIKLLTTKQRTAINYANQQKPMNIKLKGGWKDSRGKKEHSTFTYMNRPPYLSGTAGRCVLSNWLCLGRQRDWHLFDYGSIFLFSFQLLQCSARLCVDVLNSPDKYRSMKPSKVQLRWFICIGCADTAVEHVSVSQSTFRLRVDLFTLRFRLTFSLRLRFRLRISGCFFRLDGCWRFRFRNFGLVALHWQVFHVPQFLQFLELENDENEPN